jgi:MFS transporter, ACS family, hexuronate transporter
MLFTRVRWFMVFLLFLAGMINYLDRAALSVAAPLLTKDLGLDPAQLGIVFSSFFFGYAIFCFIGGWAADRFGPKLVFMVSMVVWSVFCGLTAAAYSITFLLVVRVIFGMGEGPFSSTINKLVSQWFPRREQASAVGFANAGTPLGGAIAGPIVGFIAVAAGWRAAFIGIALVSLAWVVWWAIAGADRPEEHPRVTRAEREEIASDQESLASPTALPLSTYLRRPAVLATGFAFFGYAYILYFFLSWFPSYLTTAQHLSVQSMGIVSAIPWLLGFAGLAGGGFVSDYVFRLTGNALFARKLVLVTSLLIAAVCVALAGVVTSIEAAVTLMAVSVFFMYLTGSTYWAIILDTVEQARIGGVSGFVHFIANCAGIVAPMVTGFLVQWTGAFTSAFALAGAIAVLGAAGIVVFVKPIRNREVVGGGIVSPAS